MMEDTIIQMAHEIGFEHVGRLNIDSLQFRPEVREMCRQNRCGKYGKCWVCPPYCGSLEDSAVKARQYNNGLILQSTGIMEDEFDWDCIEETQNKQKARFRKLTDRLRGLNVDFLGMSAGGCDLCSKCSCPEEPCRHPDLAMISMEAYGLVVSDTCSASGVKYNYGPLTMTFTGCILFND